MKIKKLIILLLVLVFLIITSIIYKKVKYAPISKEYFKGIKKEEIDKFEIIKKEKTYIFEKQGGKWQITAPISYLANQDAVDSLVEQVAGLKIGAIISSNKEKHESFEVTEEKGIKLIVYKSGKSYQPMIFGKTAADYYRIYLKYPDKDDVYLAIGPSSHMLNKELKDWRDKTIFSFNKDNADKISIRMKKKKFELNKKDNKWYLGDPEKKKEIENANDVTGILNTLSNLNTNDFVDDENEIKDEKKTGLKKPEFDIKVHLLDGKEEQLFVGKKDDKKNQYYAMKDQGRTVFLVSSYNIEKLQKKKSDFKIKKPEKKKK